MVGRDGFGADRAGPDGADLTLLDSLFVTGPGTMAQISWITSSMGRPDFMISEGLVVTPSSRPEAARSLISATSAVSTKNFI